MDIRAESPNDYAEVRKLLLSAFPGPGEVGLVDRLRADGDAIISLIATENSVLVGYVMLSRMSAPFRALGLAPVAVLPEQRRKGIAARLIEDGIERAQKDGWAGIFVLGEPDYYQRFGFSVATAENFESPYAGPYLMALALQGNDLPAHSGQIDYAPAFSALD